MSSKSESSILLIILPCGEKRMCQFVLSVLINCNWNTSYWDASILIDPSAVL